jgi:putative FmdB family regulatory protein
MPMYTYRREDGTTFEIRQKFLDEPLQACPSTGQRVVRLVQATGVIFKGSGFYVTDNKSASKSASSASKSEARDSAGKEGAGKEGASKDSSANTDSSASKDSSASPAPAVASASKSSSSSASAAD